MIALRDLGRWTGGGTPSKANPKFWMNGTIPWVSPKDMKVSRITETQDYITADAVANSATSVVRKGAVLVVVRSGILRHSLPVAIADRDVALNQDLKAVELNADFDPDYVAWALRSASQDILHTTAKSGTTVQNLEIPRFLAYRIPIRPQREQKRIVAEIEKHLTRLDAGVASLKRVQSALKRYRASVLKAACEGEWPRTRVADVARDVRYGTSAKTSEHSDGVPVLRMGNIVDGRLSINKLKFLPATHAEFPELLLKSGDLLFNRTNSAELVGKTAVYRGTPEHCSFASYLIRIRLGDDYSPDFLSYYLNSIYGRRWVASVVSQQVGQANVNGTKLKALEVPHPPLGEQQRIVSEVEKQLSLIEELDALFRVNLLRSAQLRRGILNNAFPTD